MVRDTLIQRKETPMHPAIHWFAVPLLALVLPGMSPNASVPDGPALPGISEPADTIPVQCLLERNHGACVTCCKAEIDCERSGIPCQVCAKFCQNNVPPPPAPEEPAP
jgi:hypothetical protein